VVIDLLAQMLSIRVGLKYKLEDNYPEDSGGFVQFLQAISKI
jgi:hypothetical protein